MGFAAGEAVPDMATDTILDGEKARTVPRIPQPLHPGFRHLVPEPGRSQKAIPRCLRDSSPAIGLEPTKPTPPVTRIIAAPDTRTPFP